MYNMTEACCNINVVRQQLVSVGESKGCSMMEGAFIMIHCLVFRTDVNLMHLVNYMLCYP